MVKAEFTMDASRKMASLHIMGHAGAGDYGKDIICASASILAYTLAQNIKMERVRGLLKYEPKIKLNEGKAIITCRAKDDESYAEILHTFLVIQTGYQLLANNYPDYVMLNMFGETTES